ncbi:SDR family NAD(P)-dependent oxidoreductase [Dactylosporangium sp. NBC_01737]|uniref:SDR family NAD(P)-dependent oxidoreductase n=1 Tax=Dactylosporangium sp. NBC_01737 TaxID=2975959 RepID=UPI002E122B7E|nr:SDR family NAD(P)-dependent oxidoreductase [Dactylosporangium sp. NBC_01737]
MTVISGGTNGMGRALALARLARGDQVVAIGSDPAKGRALGDAVTFLRADLTSIAETRRVIGVILERWPVVDALALFANRQAPSRISTVDGLEATFALYYLSRHLLSHGLRPALDRAPAPVIVNVAGVGTTKGSIQWDDLQLRRRYRMITAQLQAGRANDLLGVDFAATSGSRARYVLYHPGFTRSGDLGPLPAPLRLTIRALAAVAARPVAESVRPVADWIDTPPAAPLTAVDRGRPVPLDLPTLDPAAAARLAAATTDLLRTAAP